MTLDDFAHKFSAVKWQGRTRFMAQCPCHCDERPSLSIGLSDDGKILVNCFAGCQTENIVHTLGLEMKDLFPDIPNDSTRSSGELRTLEEEYIYNNGTMKKLRYRDANGFKTFCWLTLVDGKWVSGRKMVPELYGTQANLPQDLYLVEGEKDVNTLSAAGVTAICLPDGANSKWKRSYDNFLRGKNVVILPDNDPAGQNYASMCAEKLTGVAECVHIVDLKQVWPEIPEKGDISDLIAHFGASESLRRINVLVQTAAVKTSCDAIIPLICAADVTYAPPKWLIKPLFQRGKGTLIQADPGTGKTAFICAIAASVTTGVPILGLTVETPGPVLMLSVEDDEGILKNRVAANNGDLEKLFFLPNTAELTLNSPKIEQAIKQIGAKLVIFDPLQAFLGSKIDMFRANETRPALAKLFEMCARNDCACAIIAHTGKNTMGKSMVNQSLGSVDIPAAMRSVIHIAKNPNDDTECIAVHAKSSNAPRCSSIAFGIVDDAAIEWHGFCDVGVAELNAPSKHATKSVPYEHNTLVPVFKALITDRPGGGFWSYSDVLKVGTRALGYPPFRDAHDFKKRATEPLLREIRSRDGLNIFLGQKQNGVRGIRIERYRPSESGT